MRRLSTTPYASTKSNLKYTGLAIHQKLTHYLVQVRHNRVRPRYRQTCPAVEPATIDWDYCREGKKKYIYYI